MICLICSIKDNILLLLKYFEHFKYLILDLRDTFQISQENYRNHLYFSLPINEINIYSNSFSSKSSNLENPDILMNKRQIDAYS